MAEPRIVIIDPAFLGDVVFEGPLVRALRQRHPEGKIGIVVRPPADAIARRMNGVDLVHVFDKRGQHSGWTGLSRVARELAEQRYDIAYVPHPSVRSVILAARAKIPQRIGTTEGFLARRFLTEHIARAPEDTFVSERLRMLGKTGDRSLAMTLWAQETVPSDTPRIGLVLGSEWQTKRWPKERAAPFAAEVRSLGRLVLLGAAYERPLYRQLDEQVAGALEGAEDLLGGDVEMLIDRIATCDVLVAGDTGPLQIARALGIPVVALFGPTPPTRHDFDPGDHVIGIDLYCRPCSAHGPRVCPEQHHRCLRELKAEVVLDAVRQVLTRRESPDPMSGIDGSSKLST